MVLDRITKGEGKACPNGEALSRYRADSQRTARGMDAFPHFSEVETRLDRARALLASRRRGYGSDPGGGLTSLPVPSDPIAMSALLQSHLWKAIASGHTYEFQSIVFQPVGGMGMIGKAFGREVESAVQYNAKVTEIRQDDHGVTVNFEDAKTAGALRHIKADWCVCTIPTSVLSQIPMDVSTKLQNAIDVLSYEASVKVGLQFKRRFWEEDESIYGGITYTDLPNGMIGYPSTGYFGQKGVLLGAYAFGPNAYRLTALGPEARLQAARDYGAKIHPQYMREFETGASVAWHRVPWVLGCSALWSEELRAEHYDNLCAIDGRIVLAGEHASRIPAWQEGALLSSLDAIRRLHQRVIAS